MHALADEGFGRAGDLDHRADQPQRRVDAVGQQVAGDAASGHRRVEPPGSRATLRQVGRHGPVLQELEAAVEDPAEPSLVDHLPGQREGGHAPVVVPDHVGDAGRLGRVDHAPRLGKRATKRLLAGHHLAGLRGRDGDLFMRVVRTGNVDQVDVVARDQGAPVGLVALKSPLRREAPRLGLIARADRNELRRSLLGKEAPDLLIGVRVGTAHEARAHEPNPQAADCRHVDPPRSPSPAISTLAESVSIEIGILVYVHARPADGRPSADLRHTWLSRSMEAGAIIGARMWERMGDGRGSPLKQGLASRPGCALFRATAGRARQAPNQPSFR